MNNKTILIIVGSASKNSANLRLANKIAQFLQDKFVVEIFSGITSLPHFNPDLSSENTPQEILDFRQKISNADGIIISTPEYVFSIPGSLKNAIEWCVSTTIFSEKPVGIITAAAGGEKGHEELIMIMKTVQAKLSDKTNLLIPGVKGKIDGEGNILDKKVERDLEEFVKSFEQFLS